MTEQEIRTTLRLERRVRKLRQLDVAVRSARNGVPMISEGNLSLYERGLVTPGLDKTIAWAEALDMEIVIRRKTRRKHGEAAEG